MSDHNKNGKTRRWLDILSLFVVLQYCAFRFLQSTTFPIIFSDLYKTITIISLALVGTVRFVYIFLDDLSEIKEKKEKLLKILQCLLMGCLALPFFYVAYLNDYKILVFMPLTVLCLYKIEAEKVFRWFAWLIGVFLSATVICCLSGAIQNINPAGVETFKGSYGICNTSDFAAYFLFVLIFLWCGGKDISWRYDLIIIFLSIVVAVVTFYLSGSRTTVICCGLLILVCFINFFDRRGSDWISRVSNAVSIMALPLIVSALCIVFYAYSQGNQLAQQLDELLSSRIGSTFQTYEKYGIHLFGSFFDMHGNGGTLLHDYRVYDFLDSSYAYLLIRYGIIITMIVICLWIWMTAKAVKYGNKRIALSMAVIAFYGLAESHMIEVNYNILLFMPFCSLFNKSHKEKISKGEHYTEDIKWFPVLSTIGIAGIIYLVAPKVLSWLRTCFYIKRFNSGMKTFWAFLISLIIVLLVYMLWNALIDLRRKKKKRVIVAFVILVSVCTAGTISINNTIKQGMAKYDKQFIEEEEIIRQILTVAEQPVYAAEKSEFYQRKIGGLTEHIMTVDDLCRLKRGSMLTDKSHESITIASTVGEGKYLQFSETSGIYSYDPAVIEALSNAGYKWRSVYYSERKCDLEDLAQLNNLERDERGSLILKGPNHSLIQNRFMDQLKDDYEVRYTLSIDDEMMRMPIDSAICTLKIMANKGEDIVAERVVYVGDFNEEGYCEITIQYANTFNPRMEYRVYAEEGVTMYVDEIAWRRV